MNGTIKFYKEENGFGFIQPEAGQNGGKDVFFHRSALNDADSFTHRSKGKKVTFELIDGRKGPEAGNVELAE